MNKLNIEKLFAFRHFAAQSKALAAKIGDTKFPKKPALAAKIGTGKNG